MRNLRCVNETHPFVSCGMMGGLLSDGSLMILLITEDGPSTHEGGDGGECYHLMPDTLEIATTDEDGTYGFHEVTDRIDVGCEVRP